MTDDPLRDHAAAQPGIATHPAMLGAPPIRPWTTRTETAVQPAVREPAARTTPPEGERTPQGSTVDAQTLSADHGSPQNPQKENTPMKNRIIKLYRWHRRTQLDISLGHTAQAGYLSIGWTWRDGHRPICYWSPDATPIHPRAIGPWRHYGL